jgi:hypothetical protein
MSAYEVAKFCRQCLRDPELREQVLADPDHALDGFDLTATERADLLAGEVGKLYTAGCNEFLLSYLVRWNLFGLDTDIYGERMRAAAGTRPEPREG